MSAAGPAGAGRGKAAPGGTAKPARFKSAEALP